MPACDAVIVAVPAFLATRLLPSIATTSCPSVMVYVTSNPLDVVALSGRVAFTSRVVASSVQLIVCVACVMLSVTVASTELYASANVGINVMLTVYSPASHTCVSSSAVGFVMLNVPSTDALPPFRTSASARVVP